MPNHRKVAGLSLRLLLTFIQNYMQRGIQTKEMGYILAQNFSLTNREGKHWDTSSTFGGGQDQNVHNEVIPLIIPTLENLLFNGSNVCICILLCNVAYITALSSKNTCGKVCKIAIDKGKN